MSPSEQFRDKRNEARSDGARLADLAHRSVHGQLTPEQHAELQQLLLKDFNARQQYFALLDLEYGLAKLAAEETGRQAVCLPSPALVPPPPTKARRKSVMWLMLALGLTGLLLSPLAFMPSGLPTNTATDERPAGKRVAAASGGIDANAVDHGAVDAGTVDPVAEDRLAADPQDNEPAVDAAAQAEPPEMLLAQSARSRFFGEPRSPAAGDAMKLFHDYALVEGTVQLRSRTGAEMIVQAPAVFSIHSAERVMLKVGDVSVYAPDGAEGFRVLTSQAEVVDKGTRFSVSVDESGDADVEVVEGAAEVFAKPRDGVTAESLGLLLEAGEGRVIDSFGTVLPHPAAASGKNYQAALPDRLVDYRVTPNDSEYPNHLRQVTVQRDGELYFYDADELIGFDLIHFKAGWNTSNLSTALGVHDTPTGDGSRTRAAYFDRGTDLSAGALNPGGSVEPLRSSPNWDHEDLDRRTPGIAVRFHQPIINGPGPDVVLFDLHVVVHPEGGDPFHVSPTRFEPGLRTHTITSYDISLGDRAAHQLTGFRLYKFPSRMMSLEQLLTAQHSGGYEHVVPAKILATGIDLSDLGYPPGAAVSELFLQDAMDDENLIDPVFLGGLPPIPTHRTSSK